MQFMAIAMIVKKEKIKLIHAHWIIPQGIIAVIYKKFINKDVKILATIHGADIYSFRNSIGRFLKKFILNNIDELTVVSNAIREEVIKLGYKRNIYVYPMGIDTRLFSPDKKDGKLKERLGIKEEFILFVGGIIERKGISFLIKAMPKIVDEFPFIKLVVVGDGNLKSEMIRLVNALNISDNVIFTGVIPHDQLPSYFSTADLFILPSLSEGFGLVVIEALSCGTLAITSDLKPIHDIIIDNETGFFLEKLTPEDITKKIIWILRNKENLKHVSEKGREFVVKSYDWAIVIENYGKIIRSLCE